MPDWFVCLDYNSIELLIPQKIVKDYVSKNFSTAELRTCNIDAAVQKIIPENIISGTSESKILIQTDDFYLAVTHAHIEIKQIPLTEFSMLNGFLKQTLSKKGIIAFRFDEKKLQLLIDTDRLSSGGIRL